MVKKLSKILLVAMCLMMVATTAFAVTDPGTLKGDENTSATSSIYSIGGKIIGGIQAIASVVAVAILAVLGVKYMLGSAEEKAEYKKTMLPYVIGAILVFAAANIAGMVYNFASSIS